MTLPSPPPPEDLGPLSATAADAELAELTGSYLRGDGTRLARTTRLASFVLVAIALSVAATGMLALAVGLWAWHDPIIAAVAVACLCAPAIVAPVLVARHVLLLGRAAGHPRELADQARDLVTRLQASPELRNLFAVAVGRGRGGRSRAVDDAGRARRGLRGALHTTRLLTTVIGLAGPDPDRHPLLVGLTPARLRTTWLAIGWSLWGWVMAVVVLLGSAARLALG